MTSDMARSALAALLLALLLAGLAPAARAANQTAELSAIAVEGSLPFELELRRIDFGGLALPTLHSFAKAQLGDAWIFLAGRTAGLHDLDESGLLSFPDAEQNRDVWVVDPVAGQVWSRSLEEAGSGLTTAEVDALTTTNNQFYQKGATLYMAGGYGYDRDTGDFKTYEYLSAIDLPGLLLWTQGGAGTAAEHIRLVADNTVKVTGGAMYEIDGVTHLVLGQDFDGPYGPGANGTYSKRIRSFQILDDGVSPPVLFGKVFPPRLSEYRRRDLNVLPVLRDDGGALEQGLVALAGVFTVPPGRGVWTVPIEIAPDGTSTMADPTAADTFKQGMNTYHSAKFSLYFQATATDYLVLLGGLSLQYYDRDQEKLVTDSQIPFINQTTAIAVNALGRYEQYLLDADYPEIADAGSGARLYFGTNAEFLPAPDLFAHPNGVILLDPLLEQGARSLGHVFGGIVADARNGANTAASSEVFEVVLTPIPRPNPECNVEASQSVYTDGETIQASTLRMGNRGPSPRAAEVKVWVSAPEGPPISVANLGPDGTFLLDGGVDNDVGPVDIVAVSASLPRGGYELGCRMLDPDTGELLDEDLEPFTLE